jgi:hypothetical protein
MVTQITRQDTTAAGYTQTAPSPWHRIRAALSDMNYASRRIVEVQAFPAEAYK